MARRAPALLAVLAFLLGASLVVSPWTAVAQDLDRERERVEGLQADLEEVTQRYERLRGEVEELALEIEELDAEEQRLVALAADLEDRLQHRVRDVYMQGAGSSMEALLAAEGPNAGIERASFFVLIQERDTAGLEDAVAVRARLEQTRELLRDRREDLEARSGELVTAREDLEGRLEAAEDTVDALEAIAARQRTIDRGGQQGTYACPIGPGVTHFVDSWGFPRSGGRRHQGTDIMGPMGSPVYAVTDGVIARHSSGPLSGTSLYLRGNDGSTYFYAHLQGYTAAGTVGTRVQAGEHIAFNGNSGNARGGAPHIHFERHPGGGSAVNPYPYLAAACF